MPDGSKERVVFVCFHYYFLSQKNETFLVLIIRTNCVFPFLLSKSTWKQICVYFHVHSKCVCMYGYICVFILPPMTNMVFQKDVRCETHTCSAILNAAWMTERIWVWVWFREYVCVHACVFMITDPIHFLRFICFLYSNMYLCW